MKKKELTVKEALEQGYTCCTPEFEEMKFIDISECPFDRNYVLIERETKPYQVPVNLIEGLIKEHFENQEDVDDEAETLIKIALSVDYSEVNEKLNNALANGAKYYIPSSIKLIP